MIRFAIALWLLVSLGLAGCGLFGDKKQPLPGERISVLSLDRQLEPDPDVTKIPITLPPPVVNAEWPELKRFAGIVGRVVTVNCNNKALVDFQDGGWYDIAASEECLRKLDPAVAKEKYDAKANSAQPYPTKQG